MKTNFTLVALLSALFASNVYAQNNIEDQLPKSLIVFHNPNVKGVRLDSIVTRVYDYLHDVINEGVYFERIDDLTRYDSKVVFDYPEDGGKPTRRLVSGRQDNGYFYFIPIKYDKVINGLKLAYKKNYSIMNRDSDKPDTVGITELLGEFPIKETTLRNGIVTSETTYEYNDKLDMTLRLRKEYYEGDKVVGGDKTTVDYKDDVRTEVNYKYSIPKKDFVAVRKTVTKSVKDYGWIAEKYIYNADAEGNFGESSYSLVMNVDDVDFSDLEIRDVRGIMTVMEDGVKKTYKVSTDYRSKPIEEMADQGYNAWIEYAATYKLNDNGDKASEEEEYVDIDEDEKVDREAVPFMIERLYPTFFSKNIDTKFQLVDMLNGGKEESVKVLMYDDYGYLSTRYSISVKGYSDADKCLMTLKSNKLYEYAIYYGTEYRYQYLNGLNVGCTYTGTIGFGYEGGGSEGCVRDVNYQDVKGSDAPCPIIWGKSNSDWHPGTFYSIFYYSSEDGTLEPRQNVTAIGEIVNDAQQIPATVYDVQGKQVKTCANGNVTLPDTKGIYIIRQGDKVIKMKK